MKKDVLKLNVGDVVYLDGTIFLGRDEVHIRALDMYEKGEKLPVDLKGGIICIVAR